MKNIVNSLPRKIYSGKGMSDVSGFFFCYELPTKEQMDSGQMEMVYIDGIF